MTCTKGLQAAIKPMAAMARTMPFVHGTPALTTELLGAPAKGYSELLQYSVLFVHPTVVFKPGLQYTDKNIAAVINASFSVA